MHRLPPASRRRPNHTAILSAARHAGIHQDAANWRELWPRDASIWKTRQHPLLVSPGECVRHRAACRHTHTRTYAHTWNNSQNPLRSVTDRSCRLFDFTDSISNPRQLTDSPLRAGCWQGTHALFTKQRGVCPAHYGCDVDDFEAYWNGFGH